MAVHAETAGKKLDARLDCPTCRRPWSQHTTRESKGCRARARGASIEEVLAMQVVPIRPTGAPPAAEIPKRVVELPKVEHPAPIAAHSERRRPVPPVPGHDGFEVAPGPAEAAAASRNHAVPLDAAQLGLDAGEVRAWARSAGFTVQPAGRLRRDVIEAYTAAHNHDAPPEEAPPSPPAPAAEAPSAPLEQPAASPCAAEALRSVLGALALIEPFASDPEVARFLAAGDARLAELAASRQ